MNNHHSPLSNTLPGLLIESGRWTLALFMGLAALVWLIVAGMREE